MTRINEKLGLRSQTRTRRATHARGLVSYAKCPQCPHRCVTQVTLHGVLTWTCGYCGHQWEPSAEELAPR